MRREHLCALICLLLMALPLAAMPFGYESTAAERREAAELPPLMLGDGRVNQDFAPAFDAWFSDHFAFRRQLVRLNALLHVKVLRTSTESDVIVGKDGMLYYAETVADYTGEGALDDAELSVIRDNLSLLSQSLAQRGARLYVAIAPNKNTVYPDGMPIRYARRTDEGNIARLRAAAADLPLTFIDLADVLRGEAENARVYYQTDTHWNEWGAYCAARAILKETGAGSVLNVFVTESVEYGEGDLSRMLGLGGWLSDPSPALAGEYGLAGVDYEQRHLNVEGAGERTLLLLRDSFGTQIAPYLAHAYGETICRWETPFEALDRADDVLIVIAERNLRLYLLEAPVVYAPSVMTGNPVGAVDGELAAYEEDEGLWVEFAFEGADDVRRGYVEAGGRAYWAARTVQEDGAVRFAALLPAEAASLETVRALAEFWDGSLYAGEDLEVQSLLED